MKQFAIIMAFAAMVGVSAMAQDTVYRNTPPSNYYYTFWIDSTKLEYGIFNYDFGKISAKRFITPDTLTVYGIATSMITPFFDQNPCRPRVDEEQYHDTAQFLLKYYRDTSTRHTEESLLLYQYDGSASSRMQLLGDSLPVHAIDTPVSYYLQAEIFMGMYKEDSCFAAPIPVYERYFDAPQIVHDTFYTGFTRNCYCFMGDSTHWEWWREHLECDVISFHESRNSSPNPPGEFDVAVYRQYRPDASPSWEYRTTRGMLFFIFPILTPKPEEPVAVSDVSEVDRYVSVNPNPAKERAEVISSFGLSSIEAYDGGGRKVHEQQASGYKATLDVRGWPAGTYLLRVTTPMGVTTKKLIVR